MNPTEGSQGGITVSGVFQALGHPIRRHTLLALDGESAIERDELELILAEQGSRETGTIPTRLYHHHLPHLDDVDLIDWNPQEGVIERGPNYEEVRLHLDGLRELR